MRIIDRLVSSPAASSCKRVVCSLCAKVNSSFDSVILSLATSKSNCLAEVIASIAEERALPACKIIVKESCLISLFVKLIGRSEEHTSELQSRFDLVCRLLLEKKKNEHSNKT